MQMEIFHVILKWYKIFTLTVVFILQHTASSLNKHSGSIWKGISKRKSVNELRKHGTSVMWETVKVA